MFSQRGTRYLILLGGFLALGLAVAQMIYFATFIVDDAYISFRYAENFARGAGLVFNPGEYVEGYTNFLWVILLGIAHASGFNTVQAAQFLGMASGILSIGLTLLLSSEISCQSDQRPALNLLNFMAVLGLASSPAFGIWMVAGLETPLFLLLLTFGVWGYLREEAQRGWRWSALIFGLLALTRPEGVLYFALTVCHALGWRWFGVRRKIGLWQPMALFTLILGPHVLWRWFYYESWLPNTFYMKVAGELRLTGFKYVYEFFLAYGGVSFFVACGVILLLRRYREAWVSYVLLLVGCSVCYFLGVGGDWMPEFRFFVPILPLYFLCVQEGVREGLAMLKHTRRVCALGGLACCLLLGNNFYRFVVTPRIETEQDGHFQIGHLLQKTANPGDVLAAIDIGALAYFSGLRTIDYFGLVDHHIARLPAREYTFEPGYWGHRTLKIKADPAYVLAQAPRFIELNTLNAPATTAQTLSADPYSELMFRAAGFRQAYTPLSHAGGTTLFVKTRAPELP